MNKKIKLKNLYFILILSFVLGTLSGCADNPKSFTQQELTITLTDAFKSEKRDGFDVYLSSENVVFSAVQETSQELELAGYEISSLNDYCQEILALNNTQKDQLISRNNYYYFVNSKTVDGAKYTYVHCMFTFADSYWICEFVCKSKHYNRLEDKILAWADSITFSH
ncbi:MAG: hypothetical protein NC393_14415 [Clostridium sp.]|nr:hypothetical protein [Clostridium sp.]MCM1173306.1 hypothetical protein [Clostridium sp.]MCM1208845.1 hypothetical protein [Ruminococcus sp.]